MLSLDEMSLAAHDYIARIFQGIQLDRLGPERLATGDRTIANAAIIKSIVFSTCVIAPFYGAVMGSYAFVAGDRGLLSQFPQILFSASKMPLLILMTLCISIPSFFVLNTIYGLRDDFALAAKAIVSSLASFSIIIVSLAPITLFFYGSISSLEQSYRLAILFNAFAFSVAATGSQVVLFRSYRRLVAANPRHWSMLKVWILVFAFVGIQLGWSLRPFIGSPSQDVSFLRDEPFSNAYINILDIIRNVIESLNI